MGKWQQVRKRRILRHKLHDGTLVRMHVCFWEERGVSYYGGDKKHKFGPIKK